MTPMKAIRTRCKSCEPDSLQDVKDCTSKDCQLYNYRMGKRLSKDGTTSIKSIKAYCRDFCMNGSAREVSLCLSEDCSLYIYRKGHNPKRVGLCGEIKNNVNRNAKNNDYIASERMGK